MTDGYPDAEGMTRLRENSAWKAVMADGATLLQVGWLGPYGIIPGGMDVDPVPTWVPIFIVRRKS